MSLENEKYTNTSTLKYLFVSPQILEKTGLSIYLSDAYKYFWKDDISKHVELPKNLKIKRTEMMHASVRAFLALMCEVHQLNEIDEVDNFYKTNLELRGQFMMNAHKIIMISRFKKIIDERPQDSNKYIGTLVDDTYINNEELERNPFSLKLAGKTRSEKELYAIATFYAVELALYSYEQCEIDSLSKIHSSMYQYIKGPSYSAVHGSKGGNKNAEKTNAHKTRAEEIYSLRKLYKYKNTSAASEIHDFLKKEKVNISISTIETSWIPEFKERSTS